MKFYASKTITHETIIGLQKSLVSLRKKIEAIRARMAPLEKKMDHVDQKYQVALRSLLLRLKQLKDAILNHQKKIQQDAEGIEDVSDGSNSEEAPGSGTEQYAHKPAQPKSKRQAQESERKEQLLEFLVWVLDDQTDENRILVGELTEMNDKQQVQLADMLELIPTNLFEKQMGTDAEDLQGWYERLEAWHEGLARRLKRLEQEQARQRSDDKYMLLQQYEQGSKVWKDFLDNQRDKYQIRIQQLESKLRELDDR